MANIEKLNARHGIPGMVEFVNGKGGLPTALIYNTHASARVTLHGAQALSFTPAGGQDVLWVSEASRFEPGTAIRGGIPICWPWFGGHPKNSDLPAHGFARILEWDVIETRAQDDGGTRIVFGLNDSPGSKILWNHAFALRMTMTVHDTLTLSLSMDNTGTQMQEITAALHAYFNVSHIGQVAIRGLEDYTYLDTLDHQEKKQQGAIRFDRETDNVYIGHEEDIVLNDPGFGRVVRIEKKGSRSTIVWNPWIDKARRMADFGDEEYQSMLCIEPANAMKDVRRVEPGATHELATTLSIRPL
jgi:glucose-6-phosphate 1-epimerase